MAKRVITYPGPLQQGEQTSLLTGQVNGPNSTNIYFKTVAETVLFSLQANVTSGTVDVTVFTRGSLEPEQGNEIQIAEFPELAAPTTSLLLRKAASTMHNIRVLVEYTGEAEISLNARGVSSAEASLRIIGSNNLRVQQQTATTAPALLIPASLTDRSSLLIRNFSTTNTLYLAETLAKAVPAIGFPLSPNETFSADIAAGQELFSSSDAGTIDVRIAESGGGT